jgi:hypothetical protein
MVHAAAALTVAKLLREEGISSRLLMREGAEIQTLHQNALTWLGPTLFISSLLATENPQAVSVALSVIANYVTEFFHFQHGPKRVRLDVIVESPSGACKRVHYDGPPEGLKEVRRCVESLRGR